MNRTVLLAPLLALIVAPAFAVDFDREIDVSAALGAARSAVQDKDAQGAYRINGKSYETDCGKITFGPYDNVIRSISLESRERAEGDDGDERYTGIIRHGGAAIQIRGVRNLYRWEKDVFRVCLEGSRLDIAPLDTAYEYKVVQQAAGSNDYLFIVEPVRRLRTKADPNGLLGALWSEGAVLRLALADHYYSEYAGEAIEVKIALKRAFRLLPDETVAEHVIRGGVLATHLINFAGMGLRTDASYYVEYRFRRIGSISNDDFTDTRKTNVVAPAPR